jgi:hypothetical protein
VSRKILRLFILLMTVGQIAATCQGTETGNPGVPSEQPGGGTGCPVALKAQSTAGSDIVVDDLIAALCSKIILCGVPTTTDTCFNALNGPDGDLMTDEFGLTVGEFTIEGLRNALNEGTVVASEPEAGACEGAIAEVDCGVVTANVSATDYSGVENFVPESCRGVFVASPEASADFEGGCP